MDAFVIEWTTNARRDLDALTHSERSRILEAIHRACLDGTNKFHLGKNSAGVDTRFYSVHASGRVRENKSGGFNTERGARVLLFNTGGDRRNYVILAVFGGGEYQSYRRIIEELLGQVEGAKNTFYCAHHLPDNSKDGEGGRGDRVVHGSNRDIIA